MTARRKAALCCVFATPLVALVIVLLCLYFEPDNFYGSIATKLLSEIGGSVWFLFWIVRACPDGEEEEFTST